MNGVIKLLFSVLFFFLRQEIQCLKDVVLDIEPRIVQLGKESTLRCSYNAEGAPLYTVKWYRGHHEFYRYTPKELPATKIFAFPGVHVDEDQSDEHQVVLRDVGFNLSGNFSCEVTTDAPRFSTVTVTKDMTVVVLPKEPPTLNTDKNNYDIGDELRANCTSPVSRPVAALKFLLNNIVVCERCPTYKHSSKNLWWSSKSLVMPLYPSHFLNGRLTLKCVAEIDGLYERDSEITFDNVKDPIPARVTQSSAASYSTGFLYLGVIILYILTTCNLFC
ncbi:uncharacterized protein LOC109596215 [Aethina tumida]|uniref:uncharacterized protein LOC109596215 n=1 Tax=Aethina tumida TaxID=116153 RepID=UPI00096B4BCD|nr:uncharacterized protein LOC109596215 [Aethina tumida]